MNLSIVFRSVMPRQLWHSLPPFLESLIIKSSFHLSGNYSDSHSEFKMSCSRLAIVSRQVLKISGGMLSRPIVLLVFSCFIAHLISAIEGALVIRGMTGLLPPVRGCFSLQDFPQNILGTWWADHQVPWFCSHSYL